MVDESNLMAAAVAVAVNNCLSKRKVRLWDRPVARDEDITDEEVAALAAAVRERAR